MSNLLAVRFDKQERKEFFTIGGKTISKKFRVMLKSAVHIKSKSPKLAAKILKEVQ